MHRIDCRNGKKGLGEADGQTDRQERGLGAHQPWKSEARFRLMGDLALCSCEREGKTTDRGDRSDKAQNMCQQREGMNGGRPCGPGSTDGV